jgi:hypothetical protein
MFFERPFFQREKSPCNSPVLRRNEQQACYGCKKLLATFLVQADKHGCRKTSDWGSTRCRPPCLVKRKPISKFLWEEESDLCPWISLKKNEESLSRHHDLARGWPTVNPSSSWCAYGWVEKAPLSVVASLSRSLISILIPCILGLKW